MPTTLPTDSPGLGFERIELIPGSTYRDNSTVIVVPTRGQVHEPSLSAKFVQHFMGLIAPMNQKRAILFAAGHEVGRAYDEMVRVVLAHPQLSTWRFVLSVEDDTLVPADAHIRLLESIEAGPFDAVGGIYHTKGDVNMPMCFGDPEEFRRTGVLDFRPRDVVAALRAGHVVPANGLAMGCTLFRMSLFREIPPPWFVTVADVVDGNAKAMTQDLEFFEKAARAGKRAACDTRVRCGHMDTSTGTVY